MIQRNFFKVGVKTLIRTILLFTFFVGNCFTFDQWTEVYNQDKHSSRIFDLKSVAYGNNRFVAVGYGKPGKTSSGNTQLIILSSADGITWNDVTPDFNFNASYLFDVIYVNNSFIAVGHYDSDKTSYNVLILKSKDGINWDLIQHNGFPYGCFYTYIGYGNNRYILLGDTHIFFSTDLINWNESITPDDANGVFWKDVAYGNGYFVAAGRCGGCYSEDIIISKDGINWSYLKRVGAGGMSQPVVVTYLNNKFFNLTTDRIFESSDGKTWNEISPKYIPGSSNFMTMDFVNNYYIFGGGTTTGSFYNGYITITNDFKNWSRKKINKLQYGAILSLAHNNSSIVGVGGKGIIYYSSVSSSNLPMLSSSLPIVGKVDDKMNYQIKIDNVENQDNYYYLYNSDIDKRYDLNGLKINSDGIISGIPKISGDFNYILYINPINSDVGTYNLEYYLPFKIDDKENISSDSCNSSNIDLCNNSTDCSKYGGYWYNNKCYSEKQDESYSNDSATNNTDYSDNTETELIAGITWLKQQPDGYFSWDEADKWCKEHGGRLPKMEELIAVWNANGGKISPEGFEKDTFYWALEKGTSTNSHMACAMDGDCSEPGEWPDSAYGHPKCVIDNASNYENTTDDEKCNATITDSLFLHIPYVKYQSENEIIYLFIDLQYDSTYNQFIVTDYGILKDVENCSPATLTFHFPDLFFIVPKITYKDITFQATFKYTPIKNSISFSLIDYSILE